MKYLIIVLCFGFLNNQEPKREVMSEEVQIPRCSQDNKQIRLDMGDFDLIVPIKMVDCA